MKRILVATDLSPKAGPAIQRACRIASEQCAALLILHVVAGSLPAVDRAILAEDLEALARTQAANHPCAREITSAVRAGKVAAVINQAALDYGAELIVVGGHGETRWRDGLFGSAVEQLIRITTLPVLIAQGDVHAAYHRVLAAVDEERAARDVLNLAGTVGSADTVFAVHAFLPSVATRMREDGKERAEAAAQQALERMMQEALADRPDVLLHVHAQAMQGTPLSVIVRAWEMFKPDLLVVSTHGRSGLALALRGSFADMAIEELAFDILVHRLPPPMSG
ncbi:MAG: universal stress protein [Pseudomonadota bacterium]